ncbi:hypothetical protein [Natrinema longum]|uniref:Uncharacterized protein n=1 Tax=Natrinema longum TaxID=370324 RepID=A0A8A2UB60_9EURY|nr:hypothetical protein [Natrinema longum]MBZ6496019.1 hypothetical protein [Natrinema longum]QSW86051.1 hypothetical protein J0X27_04245 [Natrinema longum]
MGVRTTTTGEAGTADDARPPSERSQSPTDPFLMGYDMTAVEQPARATVDVSAVVVLASRLV